MSVSARLWLLWPALLVSGCDGCGDEPAVPFKRGSYEAQRQGGKDGGAAAAAAAAAPGRIGASYPPDTRSVTFDGAKLALEEGNLRAGLELDADGDGLRDALVVIEDADGAPSLALARRSEQGFTAPVTVAPLQLGAGTCVLGAASLEALDAGFAVARAELTCGEQAPELDQSPTQAPKAPKPPASPPAPSPPAPSPPPPAPAHAGTTVPSPPSPPAPSGSSPAALVAERSARGLWIVALSATPSVVEEVALPAADDRAGPQLEVAVRAAELDGDDHTDLVLAMTVTAEGLPPVSVDVAFWNRAGGLARDGTEPERTLLALSDQAKGHRKNKPDAAATAARRVLAAHGALCRESGRARIALSGSSGLSCGPSLAAGRAASVLLAVLAARGELLAALEQEEALRTPAFKLTDNDRERVSVALEGRVEHSGWRWLEGPRVDVPMSSVRLSLLAFVDAGHVLVRGTPPRSVTIEGMTAEPVGVMGSTVISDPSARFAVAAVTRSCEGLHLRVVHLAQIVEGMVSGPPVSEPLIARRSPPAGAACPTLTPEQRADTEGVRVLSWTSEGVLLAWRSGALSLLSLDADAHASEPARELPAGAAAPKTTYASEWTPDGRFIALPTALGVAIHERSSRRTRIVAPPGEARAITDIALSPSGQALAVVLGGRLLVGLPGEGAPPAAGQAPVPSPIPSPLPPPVPPAASSPGAPAPALSPPNPPAPAANPAR